LAKSSMRSLMTFPFHAYRFVCHEE
jgi:hypothetical protein